MNDNVFVASCSFGADSTATVLTALEHGEPCDEIIYCEPMFTSEISGEVPEHLDFVENTAIPFFEKAGIKVHRIQSEGNFCDLFCHIILKPRKNWWVKGKKWSWPHSGQCWVQRDLKLKQLTKFNREHFAGKNVVQYIGYASDENTRLAKMTGQGTVSLLAKYGISQPMAKEIDRAHGMLSPVYGFAKRNGCFFCPNASERELRHLYDHHPELWARMLELQKLPNKSTELFTRELRFDQIDANFRLDDAQYDLLIPEKDVKIYE